jgi:hypothetical protein
MKPDSLESYNSARIDQDKRYFFVFGQARSGTTWFSRFMSDGGAYCFHELSIACHSDAKQQRSIFPRFNPPDTDVDFRQMLRLMYLYPSFCRRMIHQAYSSESIIATGDSDAGVFHLCFALQKIFPTARFVGIYRNGMDQALSAAHMQGHTFGEAATRWMKATRRLFKYCKWLGGMTVNMDLLWNGRLDPVEIWDFLVGRQVPCDAERARAMCSTQVNKGSHKKPDGDTIAERWKSLGDERRGAFAEATGDYIMSLPGFRDWPNLEF